VVSATPTTPGGGDHPDRLAWSPLLRQPDPLAAVVGWPGFSLVSVERGGCVMRCEVNEGAGAGAGSSGGMHGGVLASLLDCAGTLAAISSMQAGQEARGTMNLEISYLRPGAGYVVAHL